MKEADLCLNSKAYIKSEHSWFENAYKKHLRKQFRDNKYFTIMHIS